MEACQKRVFLLVTSLSPEVLKEQLVKIIFFVGLTKIEIEATHNIYET